MDQARGQADHGENGGKEGMTDTQAEDFVKQFAWYLLPEDVYINPTRPNGYIEGADWQSFSLFKGNGDIEVKQINNFLARGNDNGEATGTIPFELFQNTNKKERNKWYGGWLLSEANPRDYTLMRKDIREKQLSEGLHPREVKARTPGALVMVLTDNRQNAFACVAFENTLDMIMRLCRLCPDPDGWGLTDPKKIRPATDREYWKQFEKWNDTYGTIINNMWHVPFRQIIDLATVTMIGGEPEILPTFTNGWGQTVTAELQRQRLDTLKERSEARGTMARLIPNKALAEEQKALEEMSKKIGIPANKLYPVNTEELKEKLYDPDKLAEMKAEWEQARQRHKEITGEDLPTWEMRATRPIKR